ncbi:DUF3618 domain-containing protein [Cellulomonas soli]|uniref:DUF3618 domain-containing protein n=1 Tax=Cellulomonas soli TaxID=931535 RepID=UPI003F87EB77
MDRSQAHGTDEATSGASAGQPFSTPQMVELEAEIARTRAQLVATVEELQGRLDPRVQAGRAADKGRKIVQDAFSAQASHADRRRALTVLGSVAAVVGLVVLTAVRRRH